MSHLPREHCNLPAVMGIVRDQIPNKSGYIRAKAPDSAIILESAADDHAQSVPAALERSHGLSRSHSCTIELRRNFVRLGRLQPHHPHIMHVRHDGADRPPLAVSRLQLPGSRREIVDEVLVDAVIGIKRIQQRYGNVAQIGLFLRDFIGTTGRLAHTVLADDLARTQIWHNGAALCKGRLNPLLPLARRPIPPDSL